VRGDELVLITHDDEKKGKMEERWEGSLCL